MTNSRTNLPAQVIDVRPRDVELYKKWKHKNSTVTHTDNIHFVMATKEEEDLFYSYQFDTEEKKKYIRSIELPGGKELLNINMEMHL